MNPKEEYCGFSCGDKLNEVKAICQQVQEFSAYNPEYALIMLGKIMEIVYEARQGLIKTMTIEKR